MRKSEPGLLRLAALVMLPFLGAGCALWSDEKPQEPEGMTLEVDMSEVHYCSRISPEIIVANAPAGTRYYDVRLVEYGEKERFLGGGRWDANERGLIPEGALTKHYMGPCPPRDRKIGYAYIVSAMESENGQPLAVRLHRFTPE